MLNRLSTWLSTRKHVADLHEIVARHDAKLTDALKRLADVEEQLEKLNSAHLKLRGKVYGEGLHKLAAVPESREARKAQALQQAGFIPGRPANHNRE